MEARKWRKGQSGNPNGRPRGPSLTRRLRIFLESPTPHGHGETWGDRFIKALVQQAIKGKFPFAKEVYDRVEGKLPDGVELTGDPTRPVAVQKTGAVDDDFDRIAGIIGFLAREGLLESGALAGAQETDDTKAD